MFCALNGATEKPCLASQRHIPAVTTDLPASEEVPAISSDPTRRTLSQVRARLIADPGSAVSAGLVVARVRPIRAAIARLTRGLLTEPLTHGR